MSIIDHDTADAQQQRNPTRQQLATMGMDALDRNRVGQVAVSSSAGGVAFASALEVMEFAKLMSTADKAIPSFLRQNPGMCLAITFQAIEWHMSPFAVANKAYSVNDRLAFESQLVHGIIEARAPLKGRLRCSYDGEGADRRCKVFATFTGETEPHEYESPKLSDIRVKNSPLWKDDVDQQLFYYASRSWARKWCPDVLLGIYTREELAADPGLGRPEEAAGASGTDLKTRLAGADRTEGHDPKQVETELEQLNSTKQVILPAKTPRKPRQKAADEKAPAQEPGAGTPATGRPRRLRDRIAARGTPAAQPPAEVLPKSTQAEPKPAAATEEKAPATLTNPKHVTQPAAVKAIADAAEGKKEPEPAPKPPATADEYKDYAVAWIEAAAVASDAFARWDNERDVRDELSVPLPARESLTNRLRAKFPEH